MTKTTTKPQEQIQYSVTSIRMKTPVLNTAKAAAESLGMSQSSFFRFAIMAMVKRVENEDV